jgi:hypothetical protein
LPRYGIKQYRRISGGGAGGGNKTFKFQCDDCKTTIQIKSTSLNRASATSSWNPDCDCKGLAMIDKTTPTAQAA